MFDFKEYDQKLENLQNYLDFAIDVSNASGGLKDVEQYKAWSNKFFIRMTVTCLSFIRLLPRNRYFPTKMDFWDLFSGLSLARNFIDTYHLFWYIGVDPVSIEERQLRAHIFYYHLNFEKYKLYKEYNAPQKDLQEFEDKLPIERKWIEEHQLFNIVVPDKNKRKSILKGNSCKYLTGQEISDRINFQTMEFTPFYRWFSNHTHSTPFAINSLSEIRGNGNPNEAEITYIIFAIDFVTKYLLASIIDTINIFPFVERKIHSLKLKIIKDEFMSYIKD